MRKQSRKNDPNWVKVGTRVRVHFPGAVLDAEVIEDRGGLGIGGRQLVTIRTLEETDFPRLMEFPVAELEVLHPPGGGEEAA